MTGPDAHTVNPRLEYLLASELAELLQGIPVGAQLSVHPSADLCYSMERFLPKLLLSCYPEWAGEGLDGFFMARAEKTGTAAVQLVGICILLSDQRVTPFLVDLELSDTGHNIGAYQVFLGEPGGGPLGISGPGCNSGAANRLLVRLPNRLDRIEWSYTLTSGEPVQEATK